MWRFFAAATVLVAAFVFAVTLRKMSPPNLRVSAPATGTPSAARAQSNQAAARSTSLGGDAPWALSALPDCARQHSEDHGSTASVRAKIPASATVVDGTVHAGPCTIEIGAHGILVQRGSDRLRIPPPASLLHWDDRYYLYEEDRKGAVLRVYSFLP
ncbi:MAG TPA: hypothetical protein VGG22_10785 [Candidatus Baltobacteraceae bacterium]|jgi:hypothetical protein